MNDKMTRTGEISPTGVRSDGKERSYSIPALITRDLGKLSTEVTAVSTSNSNSTSTSTSTGSATGNPRNKCALQPGHSLMDWIRLGQSGKDLTGVGEKAGTLSVNRKELGEHDKTDDAWIAIRGKVYNVTSYLSFHPGGEEELMKGAGKDGTSMFDKVHPWVNYESILNKCLVGRAVSVDPSVDTDRLFLGDPKTSKSQTISKRREQDEPPLRFDWIQKSDYVTVIFYTKSLCNPRVMITAPTKQNDVIVSVHYDETVCENRLRFSHDIHWPCKVNIVQETGKIEIHFRKIFSKIWNTYGTIRQTTDIETRTSEDVSKIKYVVMQKLQLNHNTVALSLQRSDGTKQTVPIGYHVMIWMKSKDSLEISRCYTPVPYRYLFNEEPEEYVGDVCLVVKSYPDGMVSGKICAKNKGDVLEVTHAHPSVSFRLSDVEKKEAFLFIAAGTGITPMLGLLQFLLERRTTKCQSITLVFFNRKQEDILLRDQLDHLSTIDKRFAVEYVLSEPHDLWKGYKGNITEELLKKIINQLCEKSQLFPADIFVTGCGPLGFLNAAQSLLKNMGYQNKHMHLFKG